MSECGTGKDGVWLRRLVWLTQPGGAVTLREVTFRERPSPVQVSDPVSFSVAAEDETFFSHSEVLQKFKSFGGCRVMVVEKQKTLLAVARQGLEKRGNACVFLPARLPGIGFVATKARQKQTSIEAHNTGMGRHHRRPQPCMVLCARGHWNRRYATPMTRFTRSQCNLFGLKCDRSRSPVKSSSAGDGNFSNDRTQGLPVLDFARLSVAASRRLPSGNWFTHASASAGDC